MHTLNSLQTPGYNYNSGIVTGDAAKHKNIAYLSKPNV